MARVSGDVPNFVNGVSQQAPSLRLPSQFEMVDNYYPSILDGSTKRPRANHVAKLLASIPADAFTHIILRDEVEKYILVITTAGNIYVYDFDGNSKSITNSGASYLSGLTNAREQLRALTIKDHTFIVNKSKVVAAGTATKATRPFEALYNVISGQYGKTYRIYVNGVVAAEYQTPDGSTASHTANVDTTYIASELYNDLVAAGLNTAPWAVGRYGNTLYLRNITNNFTTTTEDGQGNRAMKFVKGRTGKFSDLPDRGPDGVAVEIVGTDEVDADNYWVELVSSGNYESMVWEETLKPGEKLGINAATMPHLLVREADGSFTFEPATWTDRAVGTEESNPDPSLVGQTVNDVFFHRNRLGLLTEENVVMSESGDFYNFYRTTMTALLDTDPIDIAASHIKVSFMRHAVPYQDVLMLFTDHTQFKLTGNELLTPKTVNARPISEIPSTNVVRPVTTATSLFFVSEGDSWAHVYEYFLDKQIEAADTDNVSAHAPAYIPAGVNNLVASPQHDLVFATTTGDPTAIFLYKYFYNGQEKLQSAWARWSFPNCTRVVDLAIDKGYLLVLLVRGGDLYLEKLNIEQRVTDEDGFTLYLDQHVTLTGVYDGGADTTTVTLPFPVPTGVVAVTGDGTLPRGVEIPIASTGATTLVFDGDYSGNDIRCGVPFTSRQRFSQFFPRSPDGKKAMTEGRLQVLGLTIIFSSAAYFRLEVTPIGRAMRSYEYNGHVLGDPNTTVNALVAGNGRFHVPVLSRSDRVTIDIVNDSWLPSSFSSATWSGTYSPLNKEA